uniref:Putative secreted protein n=1 Tax=Rhipicephalus microplus TaxID=6941 RepID=A0A6G5A1R2_RHIMP
MHLCPACALLFQLFPFLPLTPCSYSQCPLRLHNAVVALFPLGAFSPRRAPIPSLLCECSGSHVIIVSYLCKLYNKL